MKLKTTELLGLILVLTSALFLVTARKDRLDVPAHLKDAVKDEATVTFQISDQTSDGMSDQRKTPRQAQYPQTQERTKRQIDMIQLWRELTRQIETSVSQLHYSHTQRTIIGREVEVYRQSLNPVGEARLMHSDVQAELATRSRNARLVATQRILVNILKEKYGTRDLVPQQYRDYALVKVKKNGQVRSRPVTIP